MFGVDIQFTQTELSDYLNDVFLIEFLKIFNTCSICFYYLRRHKRHFSAKKQYDPFDTVQTGPVEI